MKKFSKALILSAGICTGSTFMSFGTLGIGKAEASTVIKINNVRFQTTDNLLLRSGAGTKYKPILTIPKSKIVTVTGKNSTWYKATYTYKSGSKTISKTGWSSSKYLKEYYQYASIKNYYFTKAKTKLYPTPDLKNKESYTISANNGFYSTQKIVNSTGQTWYRITYKGKTVYVLSSNVVSQSFKTIKTAKYQAKKDTYLYQSYGADQGQLIKIPAGEIVSSTKYIGDWYAASYKGKTGYFNVKDFSLFKEDQYIDTAIAYYFTNDTTMLYSTPNTNDPTDFTVGGNNGFSSNQMVITKSGETWYRITYQDKTLYVNSNDVTVSTVTNMNPASLMTVSTNTSLQESFGLDFNSVGELQSGDIVTVTKKIGDWYFVNNNGTSGYVNSANLTSYQSPNETNLDSVTYVTKLSVNLNQLPDSASGIVASIPNSKLVVATAKAANGWYKVTYSGKTGYVPVSAVMQVKTGDPVTSRDSYQFIDLRTTSPVTAKQINDYIASYVNAKGKASVLTGKGQAFLDAGKKYGVNPLYLAAHAIHESAFGTSAIALGKNNLFGFGSYDITPFFASYRFPSVDMCIDYIASQIKTTYLNPNNWKYNGAYLGFSTKTMDNTRIDANSEGMNFYYASDPNWGKAIANIMQNILPYDKKYYSQAKADTSQPVAATIPNYSDVLPLNVQAVANADLALKSTKGGTSTVSTLKKGTSFTFLEKTNDYWVKLQVGSNIYWTSAINFVQYNNYMTVKNLFRTTDSLNVRKDPDSSVNNIVKILNMNDYVSVVVKADGTLTMDASKSWYQIYLPDGTTGWVSSKYVVQELQKTK
ncbi:SH3 domain-containing protein [Bacillus sp. FJAT-49736]|uniref:SH3 domain-containing protein n=1 Tax=Bacillus sp. FJAT-49736 TaxID=2833582 RepID=UPI001BC9436C|nr:SH3 domain-containing protein [Bacillus sp. FJAT-49736]MBS4174108.1 SH3 domain-containing protein [Bacillus sp. FJAT-49736]